MIYQPSLFAHINSRYHAFKAGVLKDSDCETAQFWARYMYIIQMVLTLIRATRKTTLNCMSALSVCHVPNAHCTQSQQLRTICTCVTDYTHKFVWYTSQMQRTSGTKWISVSQSLVLCLRNAFDITIRQTINPVPSQRRYYRLQQLELGFVLQMEWCITHHIRAQYIETTLKSIIQSAQMQSRTSTRGGFWLQAF